MSHSHLSQAMAKSKLLTIKQVAERCSVSDRTVRRWIKSGQLIAHKIGRMNRVAETDLAIFLTLQRMD